MHIQSVTRFWSGGVSWLHGPKFRNYVVAKGLLSSNDRRQPTLLCIPRLFAQTGSVNDTGRHIPYAAGWCSGNYWLIITNATLQRIVE
jgi:hypothetical protein